MLIAGLASKQLVHEIKTILRLQSLGIMHSLYLSQVVNIAGPHSPSVYFSCQQTDIILHRNSSKAEQLTDGLL